MMTEHEQVKLILSAVAMGYSTAEESHQVEQHLEECVVCTEQFEEFQALTAVLMQSAPQVAPPRDLKRRVMQNINNTPHPYHIKRTIPRITRPFLVGAPAVVAMCMIVFAFIFWPTSSNTPSNHILSLTAQSQGSLTNVTATYSRTDRVVHLEKLPAPQAGRVWQIWSVDKLGDARSLGVLTTAGGQDMHLPKTTDKIAITSEPAGGSQKPTTSPSFSASVV